MKPDLEEAMRGPSYEGPWGLLELWSGLGEGGAGALPIPHSFREGVPCLRRWPGFELWAEGLIPGVLPDGPGLAHRSGHAPPSWRHSMRNCTSTASP